MVFLGVTSFYYNLAEPYFSTHSIMYHIVCGCFCVFCCVIWGFYALKLGIMGFGEIARSMRVS